MSNAIIQTIRTLVPIAVGSFLSLLTTWQVELDAATESSIVVALTGLLIAGYWAAVTLLAKRWPSVEILLGNKNTPTYDG